ncbi:MAG: transporter permease [Candidatus Eremiobacteraeota bacterium]|nr:transporter permease [Candidatus Eremiobacteraeota bacterium]
MWNDIFSLLPEALWETAQMVGASSLVALIAGVPLGVLLVATDRGGITPNVVLNRVVGAIVNATRSVPFIILMVAIIPLTRLIAHTSIGTTAAMVPLAIAAIPFLGRLVEAALREVPRSLIEAARAMGATPLQIVTKVLLPEARPGIVAGFTITVISLIGYSAVAGAMGAGGLGDLGVRYGYERFDTAVMIATVAVLIVLVQCIQFAGDRLARRLTHR